MRESNPLPSHPYNVTSFEDLSSNEMSPVCQVLVKRQKVGFNLRFPDVSDPGVHQHLQLINFFLRSRLLLLTETLAMVAE